MLLRREGFILSTRFGRIDPTECSFSSIFIAEGEELPIGGCVKAHAFQRQSGQFLMFKHSYASVLSICTPDTSSSLSSDHLLVLPNMVLEYAQWHTTRKYCREWSIEVAMYHASPATTHITVLFTCWNSDLIPVGKTAYSREVRGYNEGSYSLQRLETEYVRVVCVSQ